MTTPLTDTQRKIYEFLVRYTVKNFYQPSFREIMTHLRVASSNAISCQMEGFQKKGYLKMTGHRRAIAVLRRPELSVDLSPCVFDIHGEFSERDRRLLQFIIESTIQNFYQPDYLEIAQKSGFSSRQSALRSVLRLKEAGLVDASRSGSHRSLELLRRPTLKIVGPMP